MPYDRLWYADLPKRYAEAGITGGTGRNVGQPADTGAGTTRRPFYVDRPVLDRHRDSLVGAVDLWLDTQDPQAPAGLEGTTLREATPPLSHARSRRAVSGCTTSRKVT
ncbi:hypothetical protein ABZ642_28045 [Streptomyces sp. NPDC007157]|uniref:hypothetical protein n=1 Tax=Streptomyces sp. NPDC007157 TaxID=3154681 RepID=UPI0034059965